MWCSPRAPLMVVFHRITEYPEDARHRIFISQTAEDEPHQSWFGNLLPDDSKFEGLNPTAWLGKLFLREDTVPCAARELSWSYCVLRDAHPLCFAGRQYLTHQRTTPITTPCQRSGRGALPGERGSASGDNQGLCQHPGNPWRDWPGSSPTWGLSFPSTERTLWQLYGLEHKHFMKWQPHPRHSRHLSQLGNSLCWT